MPLAHDTVILQNFSMLGDINPSLASKADIEAFSEAWHRIDIESQGFIASESFPELLLRWATAAASLATVVSPPSALFQHSLPPIASHCLSLPVMPMPLIAHW